MRVLDLGRPVGDACPPFIIASLDCRELATLERALEVIDAAADSSVDAIKLARMPWEWSSALFERAHDRRVVMLATAYDESQVERLDWLGASALYLMYDWSDLDLVARAARTGKPLVIQVGTASAEALSEIVAIARANGSGGVAFVQTVIDGEFEGLDRLARLGAVVGIQDRTGGSEIAAEAIARGVAIVEKRMTASELELASVAVVVRDCEERWASLDEGHRFTIN
jgi:sialic acid synthase SpsE